MSEYFDVYNENGEPTGEKVERSVAHEKGILHGAVHIYVYRKTKNGFDILLQKRADNKDSFPSCWDTSCAGHVTSGDSFEKTVLKELNEELGISVSGAEVMHCFTQIVTKINTFYEKVFNDHEIYKVYKLEYDAPVEEFKFQIEEISALKWMDSRALLKELENKNREYCIMIDTYREILTYLN